MTDYEEINLNIDYDIAKKHELVEIPADILFPSELNQHFKQEIQYLMQENCLLKKNVYELEDNVKKYEKNLSKLTMVPQKPVENEFITANEVTRSKIVELSKKLREKSAELTHYKNKCAKLDQALAVIKLNEGDTAQSQLMIEEKPVEKPSESVLKLLNDKIASLNAKLFEEKNQVFRLKSDLKLASKLLQDEIGEPFENIQQISNNVHWKGRAQIINDLQHKLNEIKDNVKVYQNKDGNRFCEIASKKMYLEKKIDKVTKDNEMLKMDIETLNRKLESGRQKSKSLDSECTIWKQKYKNLFEQFDKDRTLINNITEQNTSSQNQLGENLKRKEKAVDKLLKENKELKFHMKKLECDIGNLNKIVKENEAEIESLKKTPPVKTLDNFQNLNPSQLNAERLRLLELTKVYSDRLQKERDMKANCETLYRNERQKAAKLESQLARSRLDDPDRASYTSLKNRVGTDETVEYKLEIAQEKIKALQTRLQIEKSERELDLQEFSKILHNYQ